MSTTDWDPTRFHDATSLQAYPEESVIGTVRPADVEALVGELQGMGYADDAITIVPASRRDDFALLNRGGVRGALGRFTANMGGDLDLVRAVQQDMTAGRDALLVALGDDHEKERRQRIGDVFIRHHARCVTYLGRKTIDSLDERPLA